MIEACVCVRACGGVGWGTEQGQGGGHFIYQRPPVGPVASSELSEKLLGWIKELRTHSLNDIDNDSIKHKEAGMIFINNLEHREKEFTRSKY